MPSGDVPCDNHGPFPREAVRDLLGIARALYRATREADPNSPMLDALEEIGKELRLALDLAAKCPLGTLGRRAAWNWAEKATAALCGLVTDSMPIAPAVQATAARLERR